MGIARSAAVSVTLGLCVAAGAEEEADPERIYQMEPTTITASPIVEGTVTTRHAETAAVISGRQIDDLHAQDLPSSLRRVPGVSIARYNLVGNYGGGDGGAVFVRGHGSGRPGGELSTMVDGIPRFNSFWTHPLMDLMSLDLAERIEVQKSPRPVTNGNMSFSAVNVQTRRILEEGSTTRVTTSGGSHGTLVGRASHGGRSGRLDYLLGASRRRSDGHRDNADGHTQSFYGRAGYRLSESWDLSLVADKTDGWAHDPLPVGSPSTPVTDRYETDGELYLGKLTWKGAGNEAWIKTYYDDGYNDWRQWDASADPPEQENGISDYANYGVRGRASLHGLGSTELLLGLDLDSYGGSFVSNRTSGPGEKIDERLATVAPYAMLSRTFGQGVRWTPSGGARLNFSSDFGTQLGAQAGLVATYGAISLHAGWARAFNLPGVYTAIFYGQYWSFAYEGDEWEKLEPEWLNHFEVGATHAFNQYLSADATWFHDEVSDALRIVPPPPPPPSIQNIGEYTTQGVEIAVNATPLPQVRLFAGGTLSSTDPGAIPNMPEFTVSTGAAYTWRQRLRLHLDAEYVDEQRVQGTRSGDPIARVEAYSLANVRAGYLLSPAPWTAEVFVNLENALDEEYEFRVGYPMPGRTWSVGIDVQL